MSCTVLRARSARWCDPPSVACNGVSVVVVVCVECVVVLVEMPPDPSLLMGEEGCFSAFAFFSASCETSEGNGVLCFGTRSRLPPRSALRLSVFFVDAVAVVAASRLPWTPAIIRLLRASDEVGGVWDVGGVVGGVVVVAAMVATGAVVGWVGLDFLIALKGRMCEYFPP